MKLYFMRNEILKKRSWPETDQEALADILALAEFD